MTISLQDFAAGDTNYVAKLNSNSDVLEAAIAALQAATSGAAFAANSIADAYGALFGSTVAVIGDESYVCSNAGSDNLNVTSGYCYRPTITSVLYKGTSTTLNFTGQSANTYYIIIDSTGAPTSGTTSTEAIYSVVWTGSAFGAITRLATVVWGAADWIASQTSTALGQTFTALDDRLEAIETAVGAAVTAQAPHTVYAGPVSGSPTNAPPTFRALQASDLPAVSITPADFGAQDSNKVLAGPTAGSPTTATATFRSMVYADLPTGLPGRPRVDAHAYSARSPTFNVVFDCASYDVFEITLTGDISIGFTGATDGQRILVRVTQDGTGSRLVTWDSGVSFGTDIATATATTTASKIDYFGLVYNSTASKYHMVAVARGY